MTKQQIENIINHQVELMCKEKGFKFKSLSIVEQYKIKYEVALMLLCEV